VRDAGRLLTRDQLLARVWPDAFVEEGILTVQVSALRKALGEDASITRSATPSAVRIVAVPEVGGLRHRYGRIAARHRRELR
jgi:DNA-binding winged helix-turn-helix (wHTH) protein